MTEETGYITPSAFHGAEGVEQWRVIGEGACTFFRTGSFVAGARLVNAISELPVSIRAIPIWTCGTTV